MSKMLNNTEVFELATEVAEYLNIKLPSEEYIIKQLNRIIPIPMIFENSVYQLWIDKYYIAYSSFEEIDVQYFYITRQHITEEYNSYKEARADHGNNNIKLPDNIKKIFSKALWNMTISGDNYYTTEKILNWIVKERKSKKSIV